MAKAFFSRQVPFYLMAPEEVTDSNGFDAYPVDAPKAAIDEARELRRIAVIMEEQFMLNPAPEDAPRS